MGDEETNFGEYFVCAAFVIEGFVIECFVIAEFDVADLVSESILFLVETSGDRSLEKGRGEEKAKGEGKPKNE